MQKNDVKVKMFTLSILILWSSFAVAKADLVVKPRDTEAMIGDSTYFDCASDINTNAVLWYHYAVGAKDHEDVCVYCLGRIHPLYENRIEVERNISIGNFRLRFKSLQQQDAGKYVCQDNGGIGESSSAQLVILESNPTCESNIKSEGVLGPNSCRFEPDTLHLSCRVSYHGNIPPVITWKKSEKDDPGYPLFCQNSGNQMTCNLTMTIDAGLNGLSYKCETNISTIIPYNRATDIICVIHRNTDNSTKKIVQDREGKVICSVNISQWCNHTLKWFDEVDEEVVAIESSLVTRKPGWYQCESMCNIRGKQCAELSKLTHVSGPQGLSMPATFAVCSVLTVAVVSGFIGLVVYIICLRNRFKAPVRNGELLQHDADLRESTDLLIPNNKQVSVNMKMKTSRNYRTHSFPDWKKDAEMRSFIRFFHTAPGRLDSCTVTTHATEDSGWLRREMTKDSLLIQTSSELKSPIATFWF